MSLLNELNPAQKEAAKTVEGPVLVVAGPGSGKTRVLTYRIANLILIGVPAYQILALTFTNKAASEMKERIVKLVGQKSSQLWMGTFHSVFARILRVECEKLGFEKNFSIYDSDDSLGLIKDVMNSYKMPFQQFNPQAMRSRISGAKNQLVSPSEYGERAMDIFEEKTAKVYTEYQKRLKKNNAMDFDDLLLRPIELFEGHKKILEKYQDRFRFILIDEYQDTNRAQYILMKHLATKYRNFCVVGDDAQSIYAFRGADIRNILDFQRDYPEAKIIRLEQNYRSTKNILSAADKIIKHNNDQIPKNLWTDNVEGDPITILACSDDKDEGSTIATQIILESHRLKIDFKDFALTYRTNAQSRSLEDALRRNNIPYVIVGGIEFYQRKEIKDVLAYLRVLVNPQDDESFMRIVNYPTRGIGETAINLLKQFAEKKSINLLEASKQTSEIAGMGTKASESLRLLSGMFQKYRNLTGTMSASEISRSLVDDIGILRILKEERTPESLARWENVQELLSAISEFSAEHTDAGLEMFLQDVSLVSNIDRWDDTHNAVTLMTLHSAKGLEFPVVFITGLEEGLMPFFSSSLDKKDLEEERRLYYVGITRAMKKLYLSYANIRYRFGDISYQSPSRFLEEIDAALVETKENRRREYSSSPGRSEKQSSNGPEIPSRLDLDRQYFTDAMPDYENFSDGPDKFRVGGIVEHEMFGKGKIVALSGSGDLRKAVVDFPEAGRKNLLLKYAKLKVV